MSNVMEGIRILEVAEHTFVPAASAILADWGADVIKIEHVERGDAMRGLMNTGLAGLGGPVHLLLEHANRGKKIQRTIRTDSGWRPLCTDKHHRPVVLHRQVQEKSSLIEA